MKKIQAKHNIDRSVARFGLADSPELCKLVADSIPAEILRNARHILDVGQGCCGISKAIVNRLVNELDVPFFDAILRVHGVDTDLALTNRAKRLGFIHTTCADFLEWQPNVKFDVIVGNPPYQRPREVRNVGSPLWPEFIARSVELLRDGGYLSMVVPSTWMKKSSRSKAWKAMAANNLIAVNPDVKQFFPGVGGSTGFTTFGLLKEPYQGKTFLPDGSCIDIFSPTPANNEMWTKEIIESLQRPCLQLDVKTGPIDPSINSEHWSPVQTESHPYEVFYSTAKNRRSVWCDEPIGDHGKLKLIVGTYGDIYSTLKISTVGCGRQVEYVVGTQEELEAIKSKLESKESRARCEANSFGAYRSPLTNVVG